MKNIVIFSTDELFKLIHDKPVANEHANTIYMSRDCYDNNQKSNNEHVSNEPNRFEGREGNSTLDKLL